MTSPEQEDGENLYFDRQTIKTICKFLVAYDENQVAVHYTVLFEENFESVVYYFMFICYNFFEILFEIFIV